LKQDVPYVMNYHLYLTHFLYIVVSQNLSTEGISARTDD